MYFEDYDNAGSQERNGDDVYSRPVRAGKRTYFFDVKATKGNDYYLTITESKRRVERDGRYVYDKHKIFLYKEDFEKFSEGLQEVVEYIKQRCPVIEAVHEERYEGGYPERGSRVDEDSAVPGSFSNVNFEEL